MEWDDEVYLSWDVASTILLRVSDETTTLGGRAQRWLQRAVALPYVWLLLFFLALPDHPQDQRGRTARGPAAVHAAVRVGAARHRGHPADLRELCLPVPGRVLRDHLSLVAQDGGAIGTLLCLLIGYPMAYYIARQPARRRQVLLLAVILPFWISFLLRVYAWIVCSTTAASSTTFSSTLA